MAVDIGSRFKKLGKMPTLDPSDVFREVQYCDWPDLGPFLDLSILAKEAESYKNVAVPKGVKYGEE